MANQDDSLQALTADVEAVVRAMCRTDPGTMTEKTSLAGDLGFDSLRLIELSVVLEQRFQLPSLDMDQTLAVQNVGDVVNLVHQLRSAVTG